jgi:hypothetical protein
METGRLSRHLALVAAIVLVASAVPARSSAQGHGQHDVAASAQSQTSARERNALVAAVREATARFKNVTSVEGPGQGYELMFGCVSGGDFGAMGLHYVNLSLVDGNLDVAAPEIILFEPAPNGRIRITGADYLVPAAAWHAANPGAGPPQLKGQLFHLFESPNRFGLEAFYTLHVWAWKDNPAGTFGNWNPKVSCDGFNQG